MGNLFSEKEFLGFIQEAFRLRSTYSRQFKDFPNKNNALQSLKDTMFIAKNIKNIEN